MRPVPNQESGTTGAVNGAEHAARVLFRGGAGSNDGYSDKEWYAAPVRGLSRPRQAALPAFIA